MPIAYAALLILLIRRVAASAWIVRVAATGRAAFSNYLGTSIAMTTIFYGYGFGLFGHVDRWTLYLFCAGLWAVMLLWSKPWLARFPIGRASRRARGCPAVCVSGVAFTIQN